MLLARVACALAALLLLGPRAGAGPLVVVLDGDASPPLAEFVRALELHLGGAATVRRGPPLAGGAVAERIARAAEHADGEGAALVVWIETGPASLEAEEVYVVYVVGGRAERALLEIIRVRAEQRAVAARVVALKVGSLVDALLAAPAGITSGLASGAGASPPRARPRFTVAAEALGAVGGDGWRGGGGLAGGLVWQRRPWQLGAFAAAGWLSGTRARVDPGAVAVREAVAALGARLGRDLGRVGLGAEVELGVRLLRATGTATDGRSDTALVASPTVSARLGGSVALTRDLALRVAAGLETSLIRRRFSLLGQPAVDLGRLRPVAKLSLVWSLP